jgi:hypothetical protein
VKVSTTHGFEITVEDIPNVEKLTSMDVNLQDGTVNFYYEGWKPVSYPMPVGDEMVVQRYDGELDDPDHPRLPPGALDGPEGAYQTRPRAVKDSPQA